MLDNEYDFWEPDELDEDARHMIDRLEDVYEAIDDADELFDFDPAPEEEEEDNAD